MFRTVAEALVIALWIALVTLSDDVPTSSTILYVWSVIAFSSLHAAAFLRGAAVLLIRRNVCLEPSCPIHRRGVPRERCHRDLHEGEKRQRGEDGVQCVMALHVEYRDVRILSGDPPQVHPGPAALQLLGARLLLGFQLLKLRWVDVVRRTHVHPHMVKHGFSLTGA